MGGQRSGTDDSLLRMDAVAARAIAENENPGFPIVFDSFCDISFFLLFGQKSSHIIEMTLPQE